MSKERRLEFTPRITEKHIQPKDLLEDNHSVRARDLIGEYNDARDHEEILAIISCGDARDEKASTTGHSNISYLRSVAGSTSLDKFSYFLPHRANKAIIVSQHFDGSTLKDGSAPQGCGGLKAKLDLLTNVVSETAPIHEYVFDRVASPDVSVQAHASALLVSRQLRERGVNKPVVATITDHITGLIYPIALFDQNVSISKFTSVDDAAALYRDGLPTIDESYLPKEIQYLLESNRRVVEELHEAYPNFTESQKVQNPDTVFITTTVRPPAIRYPRHFYLPNTNFVITMPYSKIDNKVEVWREDFDEVARQLYFPLSAATLAQPGQSFSATKNLVIETPKIALSRRIANMLVDEFDWVRRCIKEKDLQILVSQTHSGTHNQHGDLLRGQTEKVEEFDPKR